MHCFPLTVRPNRHHVVILSFCHRRRPLQRDLEGKAEEMGQVGMEKEDVVMVMI